MTAADTGSRSRRSSHWLGRCYAAWRNLPLLVRAATGGFAAIMIALMYLYPVPYGFDEPQHFDYAYRMSQGHGPAAPGTLTMVGGVHYVSIHFAVGYPPTSTRFDDHPAAPRAQRQSIDAYTKLEPHSDSYDQMTQHPPLYYALAGAVLAVPGVSHLAYDQQFGIVRWLSLLFMLPLPVLCFLTARRLGVGELAPTAALVPLLIPGLARAGASVTNDSLMNLLCAVALYLIVRVLTGDAQRRTAIGLAVVVLMALLTKGFGLILPLLCALAYGVCWLRYRRPVWLPLAIVAAGSALGGLWWLHNLISYGQIQPSGFPPGLAESIYDRVSIRRGAGLSPFVHLFAWAMVGRFWGSIGLIEAPDYNWTFITIATVVAGVLLAVALARGVGGRVGRLVVFIPLLMAVFTTLILVAPAYPAYVRWDLIPGVQGRYLYTGIIPFSAACTIGLAALLRRPAQRWPALQRAVAPVLVLVAAYAQLWTVRAVAHSWWMSPVPQPWLTSWKHTLAAMSNRSPWPVGITLVLALLAAAGVLNLIVSVVREPLSAGND